MIVAKTELKKIPKTCKQCDYRELHPLEWEDICRIAGAFCPWEKKPNGMFELGKPDWCPLMDMAELSGRGQLVEAVRCRDCINYNTDNCCDGYGWCENLGIGVHDNFFCKIGERKGGDGNG